MTPMQLQACVPGMRLQLAVTYAPLLSAAFAEFVINTAKRQAAFIAQVAEESGGFAILEENLNYSAAALLRLWPIHFNEALAAAYARKPEMIANRAYANRDGNGDEASGDGWRYRGAGLIQLTFKNNQAECEAHFGVQAAEIGDWLRTPEGATRSAAWYWVEHRCNEMADNGDFEGITEAINGGLIGYQQRVALWTLAKTAFGI